MSRTNRPIPNRQIQRFLADPKWRGLDGELLLRGRQFAEISGHVLSALRTSPDWYFLVFDRFDMTDQPYTVRLGAIHNLRSSTHTQPVESLLVRSPDQLEAAEAQFLRQGHEGIIILRPNGLYKAGRSHDLLKRKPLCEADARVIRIIHGEGHLRGAMGALTTVILNGPYAGALVDIGTGYTTKMRRSIAKNPSLYINRALNFSYQPTGSKERPRHAVFRGWR